MTTKNCALDTNYGGCSNHKNGQESETPREIPPPPSDSDNETNMEDDNSLCDNGTAGMKKQSKRMEGNEIKKKANDKLDGRSPTTGSSTSVTSVAVACTSTSSTAGMIKQSIRVEGNETKKKTEDNHLGGDPPSSTTPLAFSSAEIAKEPGVVGKTQSSTNETFENNQPKRQQEDSSDDSSNKTSTMTLEDDNHEDSVEEATDDNSSNDSVSSTDSDLDYSDDCSSRDCDSTSDFEVGETSDWSE